MAPALQLSLQLVMSLIIVLVCALTAGTAVVFGDDGSASGLNLLVLLLDVVGLGLRVGGEPLLAFLEGLVDGLLLIVLELLLQSAVNGGTHGVHVVLESVLGVDTLLHLLVLIGELLGLADHAVDLLLGEAALVVGDGDGLLLAGALVLGGHVEDPVRVDLEGHLDLRLPTRRRREPSQREPAKLMVLLGHRALALVDVD